MTVPVIADATPAAAREAMARGRPVVFRGLTKDWPAELASLGSGALPAPFVVNQGRRPAGRHANQIDSSQFACTAAMLALYGRVIACTCRTCVSTRSVRGSRRYADRRAREIRRAEYVAYSDYQDMNLIFAHAQDVLRKISWAPSASTTTASARRCGSARKAHTRRRITTRYGSNLVAQLSGVKRWRLHPPSSDAPGAQPSRVPYEESSIFASEVDGGAGDDSAVSVDLQAGECLFVREALVASRSHRVAVRALGQHVGRRGR